MFTKLTMSLALATSLLMTESALAQQAKKADAKTAKADAKTLKADEERNAQLAAELEEKRIAEEKTAAEKKKAEESAGVLGYVKSHFSASYYGEFVFARRDIESDEQVDRELQDLNILHNPAISFRPIENVKLSVSSEFKYSDAPSNSYPNRHYRSLVTLTRENVLTEKENGIGMSVALVRRIFDRSYGQATSYGNNRLNANLSKSFGDRLSTSLLVQYLNNDPIKEKVARASWRHSLNLLPTITFKITDKLTYLFNDDINFNTAYLHSDDKNVSMSHEMNAAYLSYDFNDKNSSYFQFKYLHFERSVFSNAKGAEDWFEYYVGHTYVFTPKFNVTGEVGSKIFGPNDGRDFFANDVKYPAFALYLSYSL